MYKLVNRMIDWCARSPRRIGWVLVASAALLVAGFALSAWGWKWGPAQIGPISSYLAAIVTVAAVTVALLQSAQARGIADEAVAEAKVRAAMDRDYDHRRETTKQIIEMWRDISLINPVLSVYLAEVRQMDERTPSDGPLIAYTSLMTAVQRSSSAIFAAQAIALNSVVRNALEELQQSFNEFVEVLETDSVDPTGYPGRCREAYDAVFDRRKDYSSLLRTNLPLLEKAEEEIKRLQEFKRRGFRVYKTRVARRTFASQADPEAPRETLRALREDE